MYNMANFAAQRHSAGFSISNLGTKLRSFDPGLLSSNIAVSCPVLEPSLLLKFQVCNCTSDTTTVYDQSILPVVPDKNINLVPLVGGLTCPEQYQRYFIA